MEWRINTSLPVDYIVKLSKDVLNPNNNTIAVSTSTGNGGSNRRLVVVDKKVNEIYNDKITAYFEHYKLEAHYVIIDGIERHKSTGTLFLLLNEMEQFGVSRRDECVIGIGGGVVLDVVGLAATLYRRGVPYFRIPTTLLGIVDVSIAAKTGINYEGRRNRLGSYYPPVASLLDPMFIQTQESVDISSGLGEILKMAVIKDATLFSYLEHHGADLLALKFDHTLANDVIAMAIQGMKEELENNLWEHNLERCVDFGHSFSPIIEMRSLATDAPLGHGQAVVIDIILSCIIANMRGLLSVTDSGRITNTAKAMGLAVVHPMFKDVSLLLESLNDTVKHRGDNQNLPMPDGIGKYTFINDLTFEEICQAARKL